MPIYPKIALELGIVAALLLLERLRPASAVQRGEWANNIVVLSLMLLGRIVLSPLIAVSESGLMSAAGGGLIDLGAWPPVLGAAAYLAAMDLGEYAFHRAQHAFPWLWSMHSLHHSDRGINVSTSQRHFWLDPAMKSVSVWLAVGLLFKADWTILTVYFLASLYHLFTHTNVAIGFGPLSWLWNSPQYHRLHHSRDPAHFNANFAALLPIYDVIFGGYRRPAAGEYPDTGLDDEAVRSPLELAVWPVRGRGGRAPASNP